MRATTSSKSSPLAPLAIALAACSASGGTNGTDAGTTKHDSAPVDTAPPADAPPDDAAPDAAPDASPDAQAIDGGPLALTLVGTNLTTYAGHTTSAGSTSASDLCPADAVLTGLRGRLRGTDLYNGPIWGACRPILLVQSPLSITTDPTSTDMSEHGTALTGDTDWMRDCPDGQVITSITGRSGAIIDQLVVHCAPLIVSPTSPYTVSLGTPTDLTLAGDATGGTVIATPPTCPAGQIAQGLSTYFNGSPGFGLPTIYLDAVALDCTTPTVQ